MTDGMWRSHEIITPFLWHQKGRASLDRLHLPFSCYAMAKGNYLMASAFSTSVFIAAQAPELIFRSASNPILLSSSQPVLPLSSVVFSFSSSSLLPFTEALDLSRRNLIACPPKPCLSSVSPSSCLPLCVCVFLPFSSQKLSISLTV